MFDGDMISSILRDVNGRPPRGTSISREKYLQFSRETLSFLARNTSVSREKYFRFSRELEVVLARNSSCTRRACQIGPTGIFLASEVLGETRGKGLRTDVVLNAGDEVCLYRIGAEKLG